MSKLLSDEDFRRIERVVLRAEGQPESFFKQTVLRPDNIGSAPVSVMLLEPLFPGYYAVGVQRHRVPSGIVIDISLQGVYFPDGKTVQVIFSRPGSYTLNLTIGKTNQDIAQELSDAFRMYVYSVGGLIDPSLIPVLNQRQPPATTLTHIGRWLIWFSEAKRDEFACECKYLNPPVDPNNGNFTGDVCMVETDLFGDTLAVVRDIGLLPKRSPYNKKIPYTSTRGVGYPWTYAEELGAYIGSGAHCIAVPIEGIGYAISGCEARFYASSIDQDNNGGGNPGIQPSTYVPDNSLLWEH